MRKTFKKLVVLGMSAMMALGMTVSSYAASEEFTVSIRADLVSSTCSYGNGGNMITNRIQYVEVPTGAGSPLYGEVSKTANGAYTSVYNSRWVTSGYQYKSMVAIVEINGVEMARKSASR